MIDNYYVEHTVCTKRDFCVLLATSATKRLVIVVGGGGKLGLLCVIDMLSN